MVLPLLLIGPIIKWVVIGLISIAAIIILIWIVSVFIPSSDSKTDAAKTSSYSPWSKITGLFKKKANYDPKDSSPPIWT